MLVSKAQGCHLSKIGGEEGGGLISPWTNVGKCSQTSSCTESSGQFFAHPLSAVTAGLVAGICTHWVDIRFPLVILALYICRRCSMNCISCGQHEIEPLTKIATLRKMYCLSGNHCISNSSPVSPVVVLTVISECFPQ